MNNADRQICFLGSRWSDTAELIVSDDRKAWMEHYYFHKSFPIPRCEKMRDGMGVLIVDSSDFDAVQTSHCYEGDWLILAYLPDVYGMNLEYEVRILTEAKVYGGLRDLELRMVSNNDVMGKLFVLDNPVSVYSHDTLIIMAESVWMLRNKLQEPLRQTTRWPRCCRTLGIFVDNMVEEFKNIETTNWEMIRTSAYAEELPEKVRRSMSPARLKVSTEEKIYHQDKLWVSVGAAKTMSDFIVSTIYYESFKRALNNPIASWPEPGESGFEPQKRFVKKYNKSEISKPQSMDDYFGSLSKSTALEKTILPEEMPKHVMRWLGLNNSEG